MKIRLLQACAGALMAIAAGCSYFGPVGNAVSSGYENTTTYFNAYYNAQRLFRDAEDEIVTDIRKNRGKIVPVQQQNQIPGSAKQKLALAIDKCSNILAFHAGSALVDDALLMIGKSYFYQEEHVKAERKFSELIAQYPSSELVPEAQVWFGRTLVREKRYDEAIAVFEQVIPPLINGGEVRLAAAAAIATGHALRDKKLLERSAAAFAKGVELADDDETKSLAQTLVGDVLAEQEQRTQAVAAYLRVPEMTDNIYLTFNATLQAAIQAQLLHQHDAALELLDGLEKNFLYKEYLAQIHLEQGRTLEAGGKRTEAIDMLRMVDTTYAGTPFGPAASFELARIYEQGERDYVTAQAYYLRAGAGSGSATAPIARRKYNALGRYGDGIRMFARLDSVLNVPAMTMATRTSRTDSLGLRANDSISVDRRLASDTSSIRSAPLRAIGDSASESMKANPVNRDSLVELKSITARDLGDMFNAELDQPDSAIHWYNRALELDNDPDRSPRILYIEAEISRSHPDRQYPSPADIYRRIIKDYPNSMFADEAKRVLGLRKGEQVADPAAAIFSKAESLIEKKQYANAAEHFRQIAVLHHTSPLAPKGELALAWLQEEKLNNPDSALAEYRHVAEKHPATIYAAEAARRIPPPEKDTTTAPKVQLPAVTSPADSTVQQLSEPLPAPVPGPTIAPTDSLQFRRGRRPPVSKEE